MDLKQPELPKILSQKTKQKVFLLIGILFSFLSETKEGGRIIVEVEDKVAKVRNLKVSLKLKGGSGLNMFNILESRRCKDCGKSLDQS